MRALTLIRPMSAAIVHGTKRIENRPTNLPKSMRGAPTIVAVHAGKKWSDEYWESLKQIDGRDDCTLEGQDVTTGIPVVQKHVPKYTRYVANEGIVGLMRLTGRVFTHRDEHDYNTNSPQRDNNDYDVVRRHYLDGMRCPGSMRWYSGPFGYEIDRAVAFASPVPCRGMQGFWPVPDGLLDAVVCRACGWHHPKGAPITGCVMR